MRLPNLIINGMEKAISEGKVTSDFAALMENASLRTTSEFGDEIIANIKA